MVIAEEQADSGSSLAEASTCVYPLFWLLYSSETAIARLSILLLSGDGTTWGWNRQESDASHFELHVPYHNVFVIDRLITLGSSALKGQCLAQ